MGFYGRKLFDLILFLALGVVVGDKPTLNIKLKVFYDDTLTLPNDKDNTKLRIKTLQLISDTEYFLKLPQMSLNVKINLLDVGYSKQDPNVPDSTTYLRNYCLSQSRPKITGPRFYSVLVVDFDFYNPLLVGGQPQDGMSFIGSHCTRLSSCTIIRYKEVVNDLARILAHELAHSLGVPHDDTTKCGGRQNMMSFTLPHDSLEWSSCSRDELNMALMKSKIQMFLNIAFQAEISRYEDDEFQEVAKRNCNEDPLTRNKAIEELRNLISERGICHPRRVDDAYLLRFLRCRWFIPALAHKLMYRYEDFAKKYAYLYDCDPFKLDRIENMCIGSIPECPKNGRVTFMRLGRWDIDAVPIVDVVRCALFMDEVAAMQPKLQILGITIVVDLEGLSIRHIRHLTPTIAYQMVSLMGVSFPLLVHSLHLINYSWYLNTFFYVFKQFIPRAAWKRLYFHGSDLSSLHKLIEPPYLPPEYGGTSKNVITTEHWIRQINKYKDDYTIRELKELGYKIEISKSGFTF